MNKYFLAPFLTSMLAFVACDQSSKEEKQARRENAFDLTGSYVSTRALDSEIEMTLVISNKKDRSDIQIKATRSYPATTKEAEALKKFGVAEAQLQSAVGTELHFDGGRAAADYGGSNVSDDFGSTTKVRVETRSYALGSGVTLIYRLTGVVKKDDPTSFTGTITANFSRETETQDVSGKPMKTFDSASADLKLVAKTDAVFWTQYFGSWAGRVEVDTPEAAPLKALGELKIIRNADETFSLTPAVASVSFKGDTYTYISENRPADVLRSHPAPFIEMIWKEPQGKRLVLVASIWSLGQFTGNILWVNGQSESIVAGFQLKRL